MSRALQFILLCCLWGSWGLFLASFLLPAYEGLQGAGTEPGTPLLGWQAMLDSLYLLSAKIWVVLIKPSFLLFFLTPITNVFILFAPWLALAARENCWTLAPILVVSSAIMWFLPVEVYESTLYGFWIWNLSPVGMAITLLPLATVTYYLDMRPLRVTTP